MWSLEELVKELEVCFGELEPTEERFDILFIYLFIFLMEVKVFGRI